MTCPRCKRTTDREVTTADKHGNLKTGCHACLSESRPEKKVHTGRKFWAGNEVYSPSQMEYKTEEFKNSLTGSRGMRSLR